MRDQAMLKRQMRLEEASAEHARKLELARKAQEEEEMAEALRAMKREQEAEKRRLEREARLRQMEEKRKQQADVEKARLLGTVQKQKKLVPPTHFLCCLSLSVYSFARERGTQFWFETECL